MLGLTVIAALVVTVSLGVGSAFAAETTLCKTSTNSPYCTSEDTYPSSSMIVASSSNATIATEFGTVTCSSTLKGQTSAASGTPLPVNVSFWSMEGCKLGATPCTTTALAGAPYPGSVASTSGTDGTLTVNGNGSGSPSWEFKCGSFLKCTYKSEPTLDVKGGASGSMVASEETMTKVGGFFCPNATTVPFNANYTISSPKPLYVAQPVPSAAHIRLCKVNGFSCSTANSYPFGTVLEAESTNLEIRTEISPITCGKVMITAKTLVLGAEPFPLQVLGSSFENCNFRGIGSCQISSNAAAPPPSMSFSLSGATPMVTLSDHWELHCGGELGVSCLYGMEGKGFTSPILEFNPAKFSFTNQEFIVEGGSFCPRINRLTATFTFKPSPLYIL